MPTGHTAAAAVINGVFYVVGGEINARLPIAQLEAYDPATGSWTSKAPMPTARRQMGVAAVSGILYVVGGDRSNGAFLSVVEAYDPATNTWTTKAPLPEPLIAPSAASIGGVLYVAGGLGISPQTTRATLYAYNPVTDTWTQKASMPTPRTQATAAAVAGKLYVAGGYNNAVLTTLEEYDPATDSWSTKAPMPARRFNLAATGLGGTLYVIGGYVDGENEGALARVESYDPGTNKWTTRASMPTARQLPGVGTINGTIYVAGGFAVTGIVSTALEAYTPASVPPTPSVSAGGQTSCALRTDTTIKCWGWDLGARSDEPDIAQVSVGNQHVCALKMDGSVTCWGVNSGGQLDIPSSLGTATQIATGVYSTCVVLATSGVQCWGGTPAAVVPDGLNNVKQVTTGFYHSCALKNDGTVTCWGNNDGQLNVPSNLTGVTQISAGGYHTCARRSNGSAVCWGLDNWAQSSVPSNLTNVKAVSAGFDFSCALISDGSVKCWGENSYTQTDVPAGLSSIVQIFSGSRHTCGMRNDYTVVCWGHNNYNQATVPSDLQLQVLSNTPSGTNVPVELLGQNSGAIKLTFSSVVAAGQTTATPFSMGTSTAPPAPQGFLIGNPGTFYEIASDASYSGSVEVCITYTGMTTGNEYALRLLHYTGGTWVDITSGGYPSVTTNKICGITNSFSPFLVAEKNEAPSITSIGLPAAPVQLGSPISATASFNDSNTLQTHTGSFAWTDASSSAAMINETQGSGTASASHTYAAVGVYTITAQVTDALATATRSSAADIPAFVVIYDPAAGFVTGGGWINSAAGSYSGNTSASGRATFGFVSRYSNGKTVPDGNTEFSFNTAQFKFTSTTYDWLVISGARASYRGSGQINGAGSYKFLLTAIDGEVAGGGGIDRFRIKIWSDATGEIIYDNQRGSSDDTTPSSTLGGGSIIIHK